MAKKLSESEKADKFKELCETNPLMGGVSSGVDYQVLWSFVQLALPLVIMFLQKLQVMSPTSVTTPASPNSPDKPNGAGEQPTDEADLERPPGQK